MQLQINHTTRYIYDQPVDYALQKIRLRPQSSVMQQVVQWQIQMVGGKVEASYCDHHGNHTDLVSTTADVQSLVISAQGQITTNDTAGILGQVYGRAPLWYFARPTGLTEPGDGIKELAEIAIGAKESLDGLHALSAAILDAAPYQIGETGSDTTAEGALKIGKGVCQDHANIFISAARVAGFPARYVSGYLMMDDQVDQDASHAWAEVHVDALGWVGFDVSNGMSPDERYVRLAIGCDSADAAPISGFRIGSADESMIVSLQVQQ